MTERDAGFLLDMLSATRVILAVARGRTLEDLDTDVTLQSTIYWQTRVIGEAANLLSEEFRDQHPEPPWRQMVGIRNRLIHGYRDIDNTIVWDTVQKHIHPLNTFLSQHVPIEDPDPA